MKTIYQREAVLYEKFKTEIIRSRLLKTKDKYMFYAGKMGVHGSLLSHFAAGTKDMRPENQLALWAVMGGTRTELHEAAEQKMKSGIKVTKHAPAIHFEQSLNGNSKSLILNP